MPETNPPERKATGVARAGAKVLIATALLAGGVIIPLPAFAPVYGWSRLSQPAIAAPVAPVHSIPALVTDSFVVSATAYCPGTPGSGCPLDENGDAKCTGRYADGLTATGIPAVAGTGSPVRPHIVAVDPELIPLGSLLYIDGVGFAVAADVGGAIDGHEIDLLFGRHEAALRFGRRDVKIYVLKFNKDRSCAE